MNQISTKSLKDLDDRVLRSKNLLESIEPYAVLHPELVRRAFVEILNNQIAIMELFKEAEK